jgi:polysaccharide deacetylase family protein (PEP-CTERM system associated)
LNNAFSVDVEDYFQVGAFAKIINPNAWDAWKPRVVGNTKRILAILAEGNIKATFFILGWIAKRFPDLVKEVADAGHEVASHGFGHQLVYTLTDEQFRDDVRSTRKLLQDLSGQPVTGYRAPSFSIVASTPWAHRILVEEGYRYDSSVFPIYHDLHGNPNAPRDIHRIGTGSGTLLEFPPAVIRRFGKNIPTGGGGYFRFFPYWITRRMLREINMNGRPFVFYVHPWEVDPEQPRVPSAPWKSRFRHYLNLRKTAARLRQLLGDFRFTCVNDVLQQWTTDERVS